MATIRTASGLSFNLKYPKPEDVVLDDIAHHLAHINRYTGATIIPYSVLQHSLFVSFLVPEEAAYEALLHDAHEAYYGDVSSPMKSLLPEYKELEKAGQAVVLEVFGIKSIPPIVKEIDTEIRVLERVCLFRPYAPCKKVRKRLYSRYDVDFSRLFLDVEHGVNLFSDMVALRGYVPNTHKKYRSEFVDLWRTFQNDPDTLELKACSDLRF